MAFFESAITILGNIIVVLGAALGSYGLINLFEAYGSDNPGAKSQGIKQLVAGAGVAIIGLVLIPLLQTSIDDATSTTGATAAAFHYEQMAEAPAATPLRIVARQDDVEYIVYLTA